MRKVAEYKIAVTLGKGCKLQELRDFVKTEAQSEVLSINEVDPNAVSTQKPLAPVQGLGENLLSTDDLTFEQCKELILLQNEQRKFELECERKERAGATE